MKILKSPALDIGESESKELVNLLKTAREQKNEEPGSQKSQTLAERLVAFLEDAFIR